MKSWIPTVSLSLAAFIFVTSEFIPVGILPEIARGFDRTESETGLLMTGYAWIVALLSVPLTAYAARFNRRPLMLTFIGVFVFAHVLSATAWSFEVLAASRVAVAIAHSIFWAIAIPLGVRLAPADQRERAIAVVGTGANLGGILGVPLGTYIGEAFGWRWSFAGIGLVAAAVGAVLVLTLPSTPSRGGGDLKSFNALLRRRSLILVYLLTLITMIGHYGTFTFITPYLRTVGAIPPEWVASVLLLYGCGGLISGLVAPGFMKRVPLSTALFSLVSVILSLLSLRFAVQNLATTALVVIAWGSMFTVFVLVLQGLVLKLAPDAEDVAMAGFSGIFNIGIGAGALIGSLCAPGHLPLTGYLGAGLLTVSGAICLHLARVVDFTPATTTAAAH